MRLKKGQELRFHRLIRWVFVLYFVWFLRDEGKRKYLSGSELSFDFLINASLLDIERFKFLWGFEHFLYRVCIFFSRVCSLIYQHEKPRIREGFFFLTTTKIIVSEEIIRLILLCDH